MFSCFPYAALILLIFGSVYYLFCLIRVLLLLFFPFMCVRETLKFQKKKNKDSILNSDAS